MLLPDLNSEQKTAVTHGAGPLLIVAGAGTGKTTVITHRVAWLIEQEMVKADEILALTFTDKAAGEMEERLDKLLPYGYVDLWVMTFHSFCERILKNHALDIGVPNDFKLFNQTEQWLLVRENLDKFNLDYYRPLGNPTKFIHALLKHFSRCKDEEIWPADYLEYADELKINLDSMESSGGKTTYNKQLTTNNLQQTTIDESEIKRLEEVANAYHVYQKLLLDNEALDFGDLINYCLKLFRQRPSILKFYQKKFKYILVDEFQDTNWAQYELVKLLASPKNNLTVVGDDDQSIYKFRGASISNILQFKDDFKKSADVYLNKNYRSSQNILDLSYNFIQLNNPERLEVKLGNKKLNKKLASQTKEKGIIEHLHIADESEEAAAVVNKIIELKNEDSQASWNDFTILVRANNQAEVFLNGLNYAGVPFNFVASKGLYAKEVVRDVLAYLKLLDNYHESLALWRILNLEMIKINIEDLMELTRLAQRKTYSLYEAINQIGILKNISADTRKKVAYILKKIKEHTALASEKSIKEVVLKFLSDFKYNEYLLEKNDEKSFSYLRSFLKKIDQFEKTNNEKSAANFMQLVELELESGEQGDLPKDIEEGPEAVKVMTVHGAKGLEFKYVFVVNMVDKRFPSIERREPIELPDALVKEIIPEGDIHLQEERRLFYVAMTRAKRGLWFSSAENYGGKARKKLSRFLYEIGLEKKITDKKETTKISNFSARGGSAFGGQFPISPPTGDHPKGDKQIPIPDRIGDKMKKSDIKLQLPSSFSYSQLKAFESCPYQYYLQYILKVPVAGKAMFSYGKTMHTTLQRFMGAISSGGAQGALFGGSDEKKLPAVDELLRIYREVWIDDWYETKKQKEDYKKQGEQSLREFYKRLENQVPEILALEQGFNFKLDKYSIRGVIDRVDKVGDKARLIDYKTGKAKIEKTVGKDQLLIYQLAGRDVFGWDISDLTYYYLDNNSAVSFLGSEKDLDKIKEKILKLIDGILSADWQAVARQHNCQYCDFNYICKYRA